VFSICAFYLKPESFVVLPHVINGVEEQEAIVTMEEDRLPLSLRNKASISTGGEHAWRKENIEEVIQAARVAGLATIGGQVQFQFPDGTCEAYWLCYSASSQAADESWATYVERSAQQVVIQFNQLCATTDFVREAMQWEFIRQKVQTGRIDPLDHLWFVLYFGAESPLTAA
jgi:hypothetical protein